MRRQSIPPEQAKAARSTWAALGVCRFDVTGLLGRMWELCDTVSAYDAAYVALAETLQVPLLTADITPARGTLSDLPKPLRLKAGQESPSTALQRLRQDER